MGVVGKKKYQCAVEREEKERFGVEESTEVEISRRCVCEPAPVGTQFNRD